MLTGPKKSVIEVSENQRAILEHWTRRRSTPQYKVKRATVVLEAVAGKSNSQISRELPLDRTQVILWRERWVKHFLQLCLIEQEHPEKLEAAMTALLRDQPRPGKPPIFTEEQVCQIVAIACEDPKACGRPISHWTPREVRDEAIKRAIVPAISERQVGRFLK